MSVSRLPTSSGTNFVYAILAKDDGAGYVKFGISSNIGPRLSSLRTGCPLPIHYVAVVEARLRKEAVNVEKALHKMFEERNVHGEWFKFDFSSKDDKQAFNDGCRAVFLMELGPGHWWTKISMAGLDAHDKERKRELMRSPHLKRVLRRAESQRKRHRAWKELAS